MEDESQYISGKLFEEDLCNIWVENSQSCTDLGEENPQNKKSKCQGPQVEACLLCSRSSGKARHPAEGVGQREERLVWRSGLGPDPTCGALVQQPTRTGSGALIVQWGHVGSLATERECTPQLASATNPGPSPENPLLSICQLTTACRCGEKRVLIGIGALGGVLNWARAWCGFISTRSLWGTDPRGARREAGKWIRKWLQWIWSREVTGGEAVLIPHSFF